MNRNRPILALLLLFTAAAPAAVVFDFRVTDRPVAVGADGRELAPLTAGNLNIRPEAGLHGGALQCDRGLLVYPGGVVPAERGTVEAWVAPLESGTGNGFYFFTGDADEWGPEGMPRLWFWEGRPRFDVDPGPRLIAERLPAGSAWRPGLWTHLAATYDRSGMVELYVNGRLLTRKSVTPWTPSPGRGMETDSGQSLAFPVMTEEHLLYRFPAGIFTLLSAELSLPGDGFCLFELVNNGTVVQSGKVKSGQPVKLELEFPRNECGFRFYAEQDAVGIMLKYPEVHRAVGRTCSPPRR